MSDTNSLIAPPTEGSLADGLGPFEDGSSLVTSIAGGDWIGASLAGGSIAVSGIDAVVNPIATLVSLGVGWLLEHMWPLNDWLDELTGDHHEVAGFAQTWQNVSGRLGDSAGSLSRATGDLADFDGAAADAYRALLTTLTTSLQRCAELCAGLGIAADLLAGIVKAVHDVVRDVIADLVGFVVQSLALAAGTLGAATPAIAAQLAIKSARWTSLLSTFVRELVTSAGTYVDLAKTIKEFIEGAAAATDDRVAAA
ncbi:hypothetical protein SAMN04487848_0455 [Microbacterium sp. ru370.1]|uniref:hypothetical protein n=1 Tax=unclassified Microbacterium TaxID=2609290 RepID=UPI0004EFEA10|nr:MULTISPECIES: hypothetical protein [unclassified Microbacterium]KEP74922.1 hypothetical protein HR12_02230 [Microbacterium sp. SUBG005]SDO33712.1 hypothetical protein SAMN04487848_0455 [Microbacterium sp. ru370.1]SIT77178.1 hypothetical protein SAMN05880579_0450 [Microbacterium sp. RU1D]